MIVSNASFPCWHGCSFCSHLRRLRVYGLHPWKVFPDNRCIGIVLVCFWSCTDGVLYARWGLSRMELAKDSHIHTYMYVCLSIVWRVHHYYVRYSRRQMITQMFQIDLQILSSLMCVCACAYTYIWWISTNHPFPQKKQICSQWLAVRNLWSSRHSDERHPLFYLIIATRMYSHLIASH